MASTSSGVEWTYWEYLERSLFAEWGPRRHWIHGHNDSNLGC